MTVFAVGYLPRSYKRAQSEERTEYNECRTVVEISRVEFSELAAAVMAREELDCDGKTSSVI
jgi:hypothetical protein